MENLPVRIDCPGDFKIPGDSGLLGMQIAGAVFCRGTPGVCVVLNLLGNSFFVIQMPKLGSMGLKRPAFPGPLWTVIHCCLKAMAQDRMASFSVVSGLLPRCPSTWSSSRWFLHSVVTECIACPRQALGPCQSSIVSEPSPASTFIFQRWTGTPSPQSLQLYRRKEDKGRGLGEGGQCLSGILVFAFNLELRAVAWETKPF